MMVSFAAKEGQACHPNANLVVEDTKEIRERNNNNNNNKNKNFGRGGFVCICFMWTGLEMEIQGSNEWRQDPMLPAICTALQNK